MGSAFSSQSGSKASASSQSDSYDNIDAVDKVGCFAKCTNKINRAIPKRNNNARRNESQNGSIDSEDTSIHDRSSLRGSMRASGSVHSQSDDELNESHEGCPDCQKKKELLRIKKEKKEARKKEMSRLKTEKRAIASDNKTGSSAVQKNMKRDSIVSSSS